ncbi:MAG: quinoprotein glucose dehydrogenase [Candidatus Paceibacteria bacterium]|jgi:quinoprotein glucose dehydrogenase
MFIFSLAACTLIFSQASGEGQPPQAGQYTPEVAEASNEGREAMALMELPPGIQCELIAAEPHLANPVCFWPAADGSFYVAETFRLHRGVTDMRSHVARLEQDMACDTVEDRVAMFRRWSGDSFEEDYCTEHERVKLLRDTDGDGIIDKSTTYADGFKEPSVGIAAGILEHDGAVYYTCIPHLWKLEDTDGDDVADQRTSLSSGYGVRVTLLGHDLHGLQIGPDGWLYFSSGDRGFHVETEDGTIAHPDTGAVLRCRLDGSELEVYHTGLRNPQELAFDKFGNLFTGDNNSDGGDQARWVQIVEGADSGWRSSYQWISEPVSRGPWNDELLWKPHFEGQAAYVLPPITNISNGPSGLAYYPGTGMGTDFDGTFLLCDFRGAANYSGIHAFQLEPRGASFELVNQRQFIWKTLVTDVDFGPDGAIYFSDWVEGWGMTGKGRLYRAFLPEERASELTRSVEKLIATGMRETDNDQLEVLLKHVDMRVRRLAQFELVERGSDGWERFQRVLKNSQDPLASLHAIWGLGMAARVETSLLDYLHPFLRDADPMVRAQTARVLGDHRYAPAIGALIAALEDENAAVRKSAALACARLGDKRAIEGLIKLAATNSETDTVLRHAASFGLSQSASPDELAKLADHSSLAVRLAGVVALRQQKNSPESFLGDESGLVVLEAARAICDVPIESGFPALADLLNQDAISDPALLRRALNANLRLGGSQTAARIALFVGNPERPERLRADAMQMLGQWKTPADRDYVLSNWEPLGAREAGLVPQLLEELTTKAQEAPDSVLVAWIHAAANFPFGRLNEIVLKIVLDRNRKGSTRVTALQWLEESDASDLNGLLQSCLADPDAELRAAALQALPRLGFDQALPLFQAVLANGGLIERRAVYAALSKAASPMADSILLLEYQKMAGRLLPVELHLDLVTAMYERDSNVTRLKVDQLRKSRRALEPVMAKWRDSLFGGNAEKGRRIFQEDVALTCTRCHLSGDQASKGVGPDLMGIGTRLSRDQLVESIVLPNERIAPGFEAVLLILSNDTIVAGRIISETVASIQVLQSSGEIISVTRAEISEQRPDLSAMPEGIDQFLTPRSMRDLVEYLSTL